LLYASSSGLLSSSISIVCRPCHGTIVLACEGVRTHVRAGRSRDATRYHIRQPQWWLSARGARDVPATWRRYASRGT
jgi:hypothetical protein